jgi:hypothetical protein
LRFWSSGMDGLGLPLITSIAPDLLFIAVK